jgi:hypothetical protein
MLISRQKKQENIVEYILYMWQIEDLIRAYNFDLVAIETEIISQFDIDQQTHEQMVEWYDNLIQLMLKEKVEQKGHIQAIQNIVNDLSKLHIRLLDSSFSPDYRKEFEKLLPYIKELLEKTNNKEKNLVEILLEALYGILILKLKKAKISNQTLEATQKISEFLSLLAQKYHQLENDYDFSI